MFSKGYNKVTKNVKDTGCALINTLDTLYMTSNVIFTVEVLQRYKNTYRCHTTHSNLIVSNEYAGLQDDLIYKLYLLPAPEIIKSNIISVNKIYSR